MFRLPRLIRPPHQWRGRMRICAALALELMGPPGFDAVASAGQLADPGQDVEGGVTGGTYGSATGATPSEKPRGLFTVRVVR